MKRLFVLSLGVLAVSAAAFVGGRTAFSAPDAATFAGDTVHSFVLFKIKHMNTSWVYGRFDDFTVSVDADSAFDLKSVAFDVKTASVNTGNAGRDKHVSGPDFFNSKQFPDVTFKSTAVKAAGDGWDVSGDLSLHGTTKPITAHVAKVGTGKGMKKEDLLGLETTFVVKRSEFGIDYGMGGVGDDVTLTVAVEAAKK